MALPPTKETTHAVLGLPFTGTKGGEIFGRWTLSVSPSLRDRDIADAEMVPGARQQGNIGLLSWRAVGSYKKLTTVVSDL